LISSSVESGQSTLFLEGIAPHKDKISKKKTRKLICLENIFKETSTNFKNK
jgi:hypothetical protein